jgi:hypothetical protein
MQSAILFSSSIAFARSVTLGLVCASLSGCGALQASYETEHFATDDVRVVYSTAHSDWRCVDLEWSVESEVSNADRVTSSVDGLGTSVATVTAWTIKARQLAAELDGDISYVRLCEEDYPRLLGMVKVFQFALLQVWRSKGFKPTVHEEPALQGITLAAPPGATYGARLLDIFECLEKSHGETPLNTGNKARLGSADTTEFFTSGRYFPGYARIDRSFRPTRSGALSLSMIESNRFRAAHEAGVYLSYPPESRRLHADQYLICLLGRGYSW